MRFTHATALQCAAGIFTSLLALPTMRAQDTQDAGPILRSESREVLIDAVAVDKKGKFAHDLAQKDFRVWEDGKEQKLSAFSLESSGVSPDRSNKHYIALFFDTSGPSRAAQVAARTEAARFVDGFASPDRFMTVINYGANGGIRIAQNFTTDRDLLKKALSVLPSSASANAMPASTGPPTPARGGRGGGIGGANPGDPSSDGFGGRRMLEALRSLAGSLAAIRGRKALVFFGGGMNGNADLMSEITLAIDACNKANVAVYTVGSGPAASDIGSGVVSASPQTGRNPRPIGNLDLPPSDQNFIGALAQETGGISFLTTNDLAASLGKVAQEQDEFYLLAYTPTAESSKGSCHELKVKTDRGDLEVRARKSYCTSKPPDTLSGKPAGKDLETKAASGAEGDIGAQMQLPWFYSSPGVARVNLAMEIMPAAMKLQKEKGRLHGEFDLAGVAYKADGTAAARISDAVKFDFDTQQQADAFLKSPYHYENQFEIAPGQYTFRMAISSESSGPRGFGKVELPLKIEPWNGQALSESALALSRDVHPATDLAAGLDVSLLEGMRPLEARGTEVTPTGSNQFHPGESVFFYLEAYEPLLVSAKADSLPSLGLRIRILDPSSGEPKQDSGVKMAGAYLRAGNPVVPIVSALPITGLAPGTYKLEVSIMRQQGEPVVRTADFQIR